MLTNISMKKISFIFLALVFACNSYIHDKELLEDIILKGKTFVFSSEDKTEELTVQFMDSTCHMFELNGYNRPWRLIKFGHSNTLVLDRLLIALNPKNDSTIEGLSIGENDTRVVLTEKTPRWKLDEIVGEWTEEHWVGDENLGIPPPPAPVAEHDTIWPPYYIIEKDKIINYCLGIDSVNIQMDNSLEYITMESNLYNEFVGYQKDWKVLDVSDSMLTIQRRFTKDFSESNSFSYRDSTETVNLIKRR